MIKIYIGFSLTGAPQAFIDSVMRLREQLRDEFEVLEFIPVTEGTPQDVYRNDIKVSVASCDMMVAICDLSSTGLGYEMACAIEVGNKPVLALAQAGTKISRLIMGIDHDKFSFRRYQHFAEVPELIREKAKQYFETRL